MTIDHFSLAVDGLTPNFKHYTFAVLGRRVSISLVPKKKPHYAGGSYGKEIEPDTYIIMVKVEYKGKMWTEKKEIRKSTAHMIAKLVAGFRRMSVIGVDISVRAELIKNTIKEIFINIKNKPRNDR